jgi:multiple sugar transport system permease protein
MSSGEVLSAYSALFGGQNDLPANNMEYMHFNMIPDTVNFFQYYLVLFRRPDYLVMFWNSVIITVPIMLGQVLTASLGGFAFAKLKFPLRDQMFFVFILVMMMPFQVTLVPNYIVLSKMNLLGSHLAIILPGVFSAFGVFLLRKFMSAIPDEYCESAKIDGAGYMKTFTDIIIPQCKGGLASLSILIFIDNWNMVEQPLIFLKENIRYPLSVFIGSVNQSDPGLAFACGVLYMLPAVLIFLYGEEELIKGIQLSGIK